MPLTGSGMVNYYHYDGNSHHNQCCNLIRGNYIAKMIGDLIATGLSQYQNIWIKFLQSLKTSIQRLDVIKFNIFHGPLIIFFLFKVLQK